MPKLIEVQSAKEKGEPMGEKPFTKATVLDKRDYCIILAFAENNMRLPETAYSMGVHRKHGRVSP